MQPGDALLLMTDGLPELFNDRRETLDYARIENHYRKIAYLPAEQIVQELLALGKAWSRGNANEDDVTVVVVKAK
jgi:serine phosphatase RsbU (regulator of sigma subunit)